VRVGAAFVELSTQRITEAGAPTVLREAGDRGLAVHVGAMVSELPGAFAAARAVEAPLVVAVDDAIERADPSSRSPTPTSSCEGTCSRCT
jgi:hypothetical protein